MKTANIVNVSGGKDSTATLLLAIERDVENLSAVFADTGHEHPKTYEYIEYLQDRTGIPVRRVKADFRARIAKKRETIVSKWAKDGVSQSHIDRALELMVLTGNPFLDLCMWKGRFPSPKARFCTEELKVLPMNLKVFAPACREYDEVVSWQGVRRDESRARMDLPERDEGDFPGLWNYRPILDWKATDCFAMHRKHDVEWNPLYEEGMGRVGCMPCIMARKGELAEIYKRFPEEFDRVHQWELLVSEVSKRGSSTFFDGRIPAKILADDDIKPSTHGVPFWREYATTARGGVQQDWISLEDIPVCSSVYGLCE